MESIGITYADDELVDRIIQRTGGRLNLIQIVCNQMIRELGQGREIEDRLVEKALSGDPVNQALEEVWRSLTSKQPAARIDRIVVYAVLDHDSLFLSDVISSLKAFRFEVSAEGLRSSLQRLSLAFILGEDRGRYIWRVLLFRDRRRLEEPERKIADEMASFG
jgi:hypothetical protein